MVRGDGKGMGACLLSAQGILSQRIFPACEPGEVALDVHRHPQEAIVLERLIPVHFEGRLIVRIDEGTRNALIDVPLERTFFAGLRITADIAFLCTRHNVSAATA